MARALITAADCRELPLPPGVVGLWFGTYSGIPASWSPANGGAWPDGAPPGLPATKPNLLGDQYPKVCASTGDTPGVIPGQANTHSHTVPSHTHTSTTDGAYTDPVQGGANFYAMNAHSHTTSSDGGALSTVNHEPAYITGIPVVFTRLPGSGARALLTARDMARSALPPYRIIALWPYTAAPPNGWGKCDGTGGRPNLLGKYLKGIPTTSTPPGQTGGTASHTHDVTHTHAASGYASAWCDEYYGGSSGRVVWNHTHTLLSTSLTSSSASNELAAYQLHAICFTGYGSGQAAHPAGLVSGSDLDSSLQIPRGLGLIWADTGLPEGYQHCDGGAWVGGAPTGYGASRPNAYESRQVV